MQKTFPNKVTEYLEKHSDKFWKLEWVEVAGINTVIVIPSISEFENIKQLLLSLSRNHQSSLETSLVIFVVNNSASSDEEVKADNKLSLDYLRAIINKDPSNFFPESIHRSEIKIGLVDAASEGKEFDDKSAGVGLARKIGIDLALQVFDYSLSGKKIIISLDADCLVEEDYISEIQNYFNNENSSAAIVDFEHILPESETNKLGILSYEIFLRQYVTGLLFAESPFAFHTIGSTIVCNHEAYIKIGGMNKKKAAEDFYFLQKLAKHFGIHRITSTKIKISARESWRVPFGTGRSMSDFSANKKNVLLFDPDIYLILKEWLVLFNSDLSEDPHSILNEAKNIHTDLYNFLEVRQFQKKWEKILNNTKSSKQLDYQRKNWFDAFETLKFMHYLRDNSFPMVDIKTGVEKLFNLVKHSAKFDLNTETNNYENLFQYYLMGLKELENNLYKKFYK